MNNLTNWKKIFPAFSKQSTNPFFSLQEEIDNAFDQFYTRFEPDNFLRRDKKSLAIRPALDIVEDDKTYKVEIEMPGLDEKDITVTIKEGVLYVQAKKEISQKNEEKEYIRREISYGNYESYIDLPSYVDMDKAKASFKKGMLWIIFPKKESADQATKKLTVEKAK